MKNKLTIMLSTLVLLIIGGATKAQAQSYNKAIGLNIGAIMGVNFKHFISQKGALEYNFGYQLPSNGVMLTAVYQHHFNLANNLNIYVGGGLNIGAKYLHSHQNHRFAIGLDPTVGFEYKFNGAPIALAIDYTPQINFTTPMNWEIAAFKVRFVL